MQSTEPPTELLRRRALEFLELFARFEWALKTSGYVKKGKARRAEPAWDKYARSLNGVLGSAEITEARDLLMNKPPQVQVVTCGGGLDWKDPAPVDGENGDEQLLRHVKMVRNNLFHGGKEEAARGIIGNPSRDVPLIEAATVILEACLRASPELKARFDERG